MLSKQLIASLCIASSLTFVSCAPNQTEKDLLAEAQFCLDKAGEGQTASCLSKIQHLESEESHSLRCAAGFIEAGVVSPDKLATALNALSDDNAGASTMLAALSFGPNKKSAASSTHSSCSKSGSAAYALLGSMAKAATNIANLGLSDDGTASLPSCSGGETQLECLTSTIDQNIDQAIKDIDDTDGTSEEIEARIDDVVELTSNIVDVYQATCTTKVVIADICDQLDLAIENADSGNQNLINEILNEPDETTKKNLLKVLAKSLLSEWKK